MLDPWALANSRWKKKAVGWLYANAHLRNAACIHALCESEARSIRAYGLKNPICIIPNGIDLPPDGGRRTEDGSQPSALCPLPSDRKVLLYLGRIHPKKGLVNLLKAWSEVARSQSSAFCPPSSDWTLAIAGWDQAGHETELKQLATELAIPWTDLREQRAGFSMSDFQRFSVFFLGPQFGEGKTACYANCDAFILPSFSEGLPMVILEAWAYSKPVLMTPECNIPEGFTANAAIRITPSAESIAQGLANLFRHPPSDLRSLGQRGRDLVQRRFTWPKIADEMSAVYRWVLGDGTPPTTIHFN